MKKDQIKVGGLYTARVSGKFTTVRVDAIREIDGLKYPIGGAGSYGAKRTVRGETHYEVTNLTTGRKTTFRSAAKFRGEVVERGNEEYKSLKPTTAEQTYQGLTGRLDLPPEDEPVLEDGCPFAAPTPATATNSSDILITAKVVEATHGEENGFLNGDIRLLDLQETPRPFPSLTASATTPTSPADSVGAAPAGPARATSGPGTTQAEGEQLPSLTTKPTFGELYGGPAGHFPEQVPDAYQRVKEKFAEMSEANAAQTTTTPAPAATTEGEQRSDPTLAVPAAAVGTATTRHTADSNQLTSRLGIAARIAAQGAPVATGLTQEQEEILTTAKVVEAERGNGQRVLVIGAGAGTGKTFTLKQLEQVLRGNGQYTAFNSSLVDDSRDEFKRAACNTTHSLAFRAVGKQYQHRLGGRRVRSWEVAGRLGIQDLTVELSAALAPPEADGQPQTRRLKAAFLAGQVTEAIRKFCQSADAEVGVEHFGRLDGIDEAGKRDNNDRVKAHLLPFVRAAWADLADPQGTLPFAHDVYVKLWQLGRDKDRPVIAADYILLDEAQDTAPVMLDILQQQRHALLVLVGDDNQQIYEWRGAVNAMVSFPDAPRRLLSQSFRFGQAVADVANAVLAGLEQPTDLVMRGLPAIPSRVCAVDRPRCYLYRTNEGAVGKIMEVMDAGKRGYLIGGTSEVVSFCRAALELQQGRGTSHPELGCFEKWAEVQEYVKSDEGADLRLMVKLIDKFRAERIIAALDNMPPEDKADLVATTAHRSKGREWSSVRLGEDFPTANKLSDSDRRLVYVACTRAQEELDLTVCPTFCGGRDGLGPDAEWVPGIEVQYTAPVPSAEDLAAYRAARVASKPPLTTTAPLPAANGRAAPAADVAAGNGQISAPAGGYRWISRAGKWVIQGPADPTFFRGRRVMVPSRVGTKEIILYTIIEQVGDKWVYGVDVNEK